MTLVQVDPTENLVDFEVPVSLRATAPIETKLGSRDLVRLMVSDEQGAVHRRFTDLARSLRPGDLLVVNNSATLPAAVVVDDSLVVHFSTAQPGGFVVVEPRKPVAHWSIRPDTTPQSGPIALPDDALLDLLAPYPVGSKSSRLWLARFEHDLKLTDYLARVGRPIRYDHVDRGYPLADYQTIFASVPGSAELPSAGRPFSGRVLAALASAGVGVAPVTLHTGASSLEAGEAPYPEWAAVPAATARLVDSAKESGGRVIAVGTTVVRVLESAVDRMGRLHPFTGWTDLHITPGYEVRALDGLITGWHEPQSTHLSMLEAIAGKGRLRSIYHEALNRGYLWHEFGDSLLILPG